MKVLLPRLVAGYRLKLVIFILSGLFLLAACEAMASYLRGDWTGITYLLWFDQTILNTMIAAMLLLWFRPNVPLIMLPAMLFVGEAIYSGNWLIGTLHSLLSSLEVYHQLLGRHATRVVNPQYAMLIVYATAWLGLLVTVITKRTRSFDRLLCMISAAAIMATFTLFHVFLIGGLGHAIDREKEVVAAALQTSDDTNFRNGCDSLMLRCQVLDRTGDLKDIETGEPPAKGPQRTITDIIASGATFTRPFVWSEQQAAGDGKNTFVAGIVATRDRLFLAMSGDRFAETVDYEGERFIIQSLAAHVTWFLIFVAITGIHRKVARPKVRKVLGPNAFA